MDAPRHEPVLLAEVVALLRPERGGLFVDATLGLGGHAEALLAASPLVRLVGIDRDPEALALARERLSPYGDRLVTVHGRHEEIARHLDDLDIRSVDGVLADLGVSSLQLDRPDRGFSFMRDGPLDMRMDREGRTAADLVATLSADELSRVFREYGEEPRSGAAGTGPGDARLPGPPDRDEPGAGRAPPVPRRRDRPPRAGREDRRPLLPLARGQDRQDGALREGGFLLVPPLLPGLRLHEAPRPRAPHEEAAPALRRGGPAQPPLPLRAPEGRREGRLRPLRGSVYAIRRPVENVYLVRERDRRRTRELVALLFAALPMMAVIFAAIWANVETLRLGYQIERLQKQRDQLAERQRQLLTEKAEASALGRVAEVARTQLGLGTARPGQLVFVAHGTLPAAPAVSSAPARRATPATVPTEEGF